MTENTALGKHELRLQQNLTKILRGYSSLNSALSADAAKKMLSIQAHSTEARNSSSQVGMNDVTGTGTRLSAKSCSLRHWLLQPQHL